MAEIGNWNTLKVLKRLNFGIYLDGEELGEILMPARYVPQNCAPGDTVQAFIYLDSEDRLVATTETPLAKVGEFAYLQVNSVTAIGAFLNWGLPKDLFVPFREQSKKMETGSFYIVRIYIDDESHRIVASSRLDTFLDNLPPDYSIGQEIDLIVEKETDLGFKVIINNLHRGVLFRSDIFEPMPIGKRRKGYIKRIREDEKN